MESKPIEWYNEKNQRHQKAIHKTEIHDTFIAFDVMNELKQGKTPDEIDEKLRILIKGEIEKRLHEIGYWDFIPIPKIEVKEINQQSNLESFLDDDEKEE